MNNSKIALDSVRTTDKKAEWSKRESDLIKILEAIREIQDSHAWSSLKDLIFDGEERLLEKEITSQAKKDKPDPLMLRFLSGRLFQAEKYNLQKLESKYRTELSGVRLKLYGKTEEIGSA